MLFLLVADEELLALKHAAVTRSSEYRQMLIKTNTGSWAMKTLKLKID
jgi:hypothetical protein